MKSTLITSATRSGLALIATAFFFSPAYAGIKLYSPSVEEGMFELEQRNEWFEDDDPAKDNKRKHYFAVGYGVTSWWKTELYGVLERDAGPSQPLRYAETEWENIFQFTEKGEYWVHVGAKLEYEIKHVSQSADKMAAALLLEKDFGRFETIANINFEREVGSYRSGGTEFGIGIGTRYLYNPHFEPGIELHSEFGRLSDTKNYSSQSHRMGPVAHGDIGHGFSYEVGALAGISHGAPDASLKLYLEYEFPL